MSTSFKDTNGKTWLVALNVSIARRLKDQLELDLCEKLGLELLEKIASDPIELANVLFVIVQDQATAAGISDEQFGSALSGDVMEEAANALMEAIANFFPSARRQVIAKAMGKLREVEARTSARAIKLLDDPTIDQAIERQMALAETKLKADFGGPSTTSPGS